MSGATVTPDPGGTQGPGAGAGADAGGRWLVEASAGTGKTHRIEGLALELVAGGTPLDRVLIVTFTRAAAAELRRRVRRRLVRAAEAVGAVRRGVLAPDGAAIRDEVVLRLVAGASDADLALTEERLRHSLERIDDAVIDTIHGFCGRMLGQVALDVELDPSAEPVEDLRPLLGEVVADLMVAELRGASPALVALVVDRHRVDRARLVEVAARLEAEPGLVVVPEREGDAPRGRRGFAAALERELEVLTARLREAWLEGSTALWDALLAGHRAKDLEASLYIPSKAGRDRASVDDWARGGGHLDGGTLGALEPFSLRRILARARGSVDVPDTIPTLVDALDDVATTFLVEAAQRLRVEVAARKRRRRVLSFSDLLVALEAALADPERGAAVAGAIRGRFDAALIDEFQDTDPVQWAIFSRLFPAAPGNLPSGRLHLVGDPKQAIYAFRGADVATYLVARDTVPTSHRLGLDVNWRSEEGLVAALNDLFDRPEHFGHAGAFGDAGVPYRRVTAARAGDGPGILGGPSPTAPLQFHLVRRDVRDDDSGEDGEAVKALGSAWAARHLPLVVADGIAELVGSDATVDDPELGRRPLHPGDVAVLVATNRQAEQVRGALATAGVPAVSRTDQRVLATREAADLALVLAALLAPGSERRLRAALATPILGSTAAELVDLDEDARLVWAERCAGWGERWRRDGVAAAFQDLARDTALPARVVATRRGERALTNLRHLVEVLAGAERAERLRPDALVAWLARAREDADATGEQQLRLESDAEAVRVVTVHSSKGLEYPVVWCPFLWSTRAVGERDVVTRLHDPERGALVLDLELSRFEPAHRARLLAHAGELDRERARLLYVALTRARDRVVVHTGALRGSGESALQHVLFGRDALKVAPLGVGDEPRSDDELRADLARLEGPNTAVVEVTDVRGLPRRLDVDARAEVTLTAARLGRPIDRSWRRSSFSTLVHDDVRPDDPEADGVDHDERASGSPTAVDGDLDDRGDGPVEAAHAAAPVPLAWFPRGPGAGDLLHRLMERLDPEVVRPGAPDVDALGRLLDELVIGVERGLAAAVTDPAAVQRLADGLGLALATPLGPRLSDATLASIARGDRLHELRFDLPLAPRAPGGRSAPTLADLAAVIARHADRHAPRALGAVVTRLRARGSRPLRGLLTGSIDLVARVDGRYAVLDHKSNRLPMDARVEPTVAHYAHDRLERVVADRGYALQGLLYVVALHRFLRQRLAGYDPDAHVAGAGFLFVRGMVGEAAPRGADGAPSGVWWLAPDRAFVEDLDDLIAGAAA